MLRMMLPSLLIGFSLSSAAIAAEDPVKAVVASAIAQYARLDGTAVTGTQVGEDAYGKFIALRSYYGQKAKFGGTSSELAVDFPFEEGETIVYSWRMKVPSAMFAYDPQNRWWLLARWNDQPNKAFGQRETDFLGHNPTILFGYKLAEGRDTLTLSYGIPEAVNVGTFSIPRDEWIKLTMEVTWSRSASVGKAKLFVNDSKVPFKEMTGRNMYGKYRTLFRVGNFRSGEIQTEASLMIGDVKVERKQ